MDRPELVASRTWDCPAAAKRNEILAKKLYVGNLPFSITEDELRSTFERHGAVASVNVIMDRDTGRPRGFAFVEMDEASGADDAMRALDGSELGGRTVKVNEAEDKNRGGGGGRGRY
jgi:RNA recognition motif-containing protein